MLVLYLSSSFAQTEGQITCNYEPFPHSLNTISYLNLTQEFHIHGQYLFNMSTYYFISRFSLTQESLFRFYVAPHDVDVDLWLYDGDTGEFIAHSSLEIGTEEVIAHTLPQGNYIFKFNFFGFIFGQYRPNTCDTLTLEGSIVPKTTVLNRVSQYACPPAESKGKSGSLTCIISPRDPPVMKSNPNTASTFQRFCFPFTSVKVKL